NAEGKRDGRTLSYRTAEIHHIGLLVRAMRITRSAVVPVGVVFGILAMLVMSFGVLPSVAALFDSGPAIRDMASMVGWGTFSAEHAIFGLALGLVGLAIASRSDA
ncbi:MAG: hypothetical protein ACRDVD_05860, partial [Acidimicrobiia bacterium]